MPDATCRMCRDESPTFSRRDVIRVLGTSAAALAVSGTPLAAALPSTKKPPEKPPEKPPGKSPESVVKLLHDSLNPQQRKAVCFAWDHVDKTNGLLRTRISNNWRITPQQIKSAFYSADQQQMIRDIFEGVVNPDWIERFDRQFKDDLGGFGKQQGIAIFGEPGSEKFEFVLTGRHGTVRCDGNTTDHVAFGGPILYGHAASGYFEKDTHPGNVFWHQAQAANKVYQMFDGKQRKMALVDTSPDEASIAFRGKEGKFDGIPIKELSGDQREHVQKVMQLLIEPYRQSDQDEVVAALKAQGGLDQCHLAFYADEDMGEDQVWDNWRLEGPAFVWHYRGAPHVHVWINVADDPSVKLNGKNLSGALHEKDKK